MLAEDPALVCKEYYESYKILKQSDLFDCFYRMPKPVVHHAHLTACASPEFLVSLTYYDFVFYSEKENIFYVSRTGCDKPGYIEVSKLRAHWSNAKEFDTYLKDKIIMKTDAKEDHGKWAAF